LRGGKWHKEPVDQTQETVATTTKTGDDSNAPVTLIPAQPLTADLLTPQEQFWNLKLVVGFTALLSLYFGICEPTWLKAICASVAVAVVCGVLLIDEESCDAARPCDKK
jgi:hypothetical protein